MTEEYPLFLHFLSVYLLLRLLENPERRLLYFILGLNFGVSFLFRPNNAMVELIVGGVLALAQFRRRMLLRQWRSFAFLAAGALLPVLATALYFARYGLFKDLLDATLIYNFSYGSTKIGSQTPFGRLYAVAGAPAWFATLGYGLALWRFYNSIKSEGRDFYLYLLLVVGSPLCVFLSDPAQRGYEHYFINTLPALGLLAGIAFSFLAEAAPANAAGNKYWLVLTVLILASAGYFVLSGKLGQYFLVRDPTVKNFWSKNQRFTPISKYARLHSKPDETVLFWGAWSGENFMASRLSASSVLFYPTLAPSAITDRLNARFVEEVKANRPVLIVDMLDPFLPAIDPLKRKRQPESPLAAHLADNLDELFAYIHENYVFKESFAGKDVYYRAETK